MIDFVGILCYTIYMKDKYCKICCYKIDSSSFFIVNEKDTKQTYHIACYTENYNIQFIKDKQIKRRKIG